MSNWAYGQQDPTDGNGDTNAILFMCRQMIAQIATMKIVQVKTVHGGGVNPQGTVDVIPLVSQIDGAGYGTPHGVVPGLPWSRVQGGSNAVICDPVAGDIGYVVASDRDISTVKQNGAAGLPGSRRRFDIADGVYCGGCLSVSPTQYLIFTSTGVRLVDANGNSITMSSTGMNLTDKNGNQIQMTAGVVNVVTGSFQVNGVPVTVP
jgi:uncharacterized spore protein YtfJ